MGATNRVAGLTDVSKRYGANLALDRVSLGIEKGRVTALLGPNGAGKTTTVALLLGLAKADVGQAELFGRSPQELAVRRRIGVMLQTAGLIETLQVRELVQLTSSYYPRPRGLSEVGDLAGIGGLLGKRYGLLSGGQQRRVQFALAICGRPELLFLDEPTTGLDIEARESLWDVVRAMVAEGCAVLLTTHYLEEAEALAHRVEVLMHGRIVAAGTVDEIRAMGVRRRIRCVSEVAAAEVLGWPGVDGVEDVGRVDGAVSTPGLGARERRRLEISVGVAEPVVRRLLEMDPGLSELEVTQAGLAEAFVQITKGAAGAMHAAGGRGHEAAPWSDGGRVVRAQGAATPSGRALGRVVS